MNQWDYTGFVLILIGSMSAYMEFIRGTAYPTILVLSSCGLFILSYLLAGGDRVLRIPRFVFWALIILFGVYAFTMPFRPIVFYRPIIDLIVITVSMLLIPQVIDRSTFFVTVRSLSTTLVLVGLPAVFIGPYSLLGTTVGYQWQAELPVLSSQLYPLQSIYTNPNFLSIFILAGMLVSLYLFDTDRTSYSLFMLFANGVGLLLTQSRSAIVIGFLAVIGYLFYKIWGIQLFRLAILGSVLLGVGGLILLVTGVGPLAQVSLSGRREIWRTGISMLLEKPFVGYGPVPLGPIIETELGSSKSPHNSYLRIFLETGIIGGVTYSLLITSVIFYHIRICLNENLVITVLLAVSITGTMIFETFTIGGVGSSSMLASITLGYLIHDINSYVDRKN